MFKCITPSDNTLCKYVHHIYMKQYSLKYDFTKHFTKNRGIFEYFKHQIRRKKTEKQRYITHNLPYSLYSLFRRGSLATAAAAATPYHEEAAAAETAFTECNTLDSIGFISSGFE